MFVEVILHSADPSKLPRRRGIRWNTLNGAPKNEPGEVALYGEHAAIIRYVADVWGVEDREWFAERVVLGARECSVHVWNEPRHA